MKVTAGRLVARAIIQRACTSSPRMPKAAAKSRPSPSSASRNAIDDKSLEPWLPKQKKFSHILSTMQRAIEAQERIIQITTKLKKDLVHKVFTEGFLNEPQKQTEIGPIPESRELIRCEDACKTTSVGIEKANDGPLAKSKLRPGDVLIVRTQLPRRNP